MHPVADDEQSKVHYWFGVARARELWIAALALNPISLGVIPMRSLSPASRLAVLLSLLLFNSPTYSETLSLSEAITIDGVLE